jgi:hypothetical protein
MAYEEPMVISVDTDVLDEVLSAAAGCASGNVFCQNYTTYQNALQACAQTGTYNPAQGLTPQQCAQHGVYYN